MVFCCFLVGSMLHGQATHIIKPDGTGDYETIQAGIMAAQEGDTIALTDGVFQGPDNYNIVTYGKAITIKSLSGNAEACIIKPGYQADTVKRGFWLDNNETPKTIIRDLSIHEAVAIQNCGEIFGGGIYIGPNSRPRFINVIIYNCNAWYGGGIYCADSSAPSFVNCQIAYNGARFQAGGIYVNYGSSPIIENCIFNDNFAMEETGCVLFRAAGRTQLNNCVFYNNTVPGPRGSAITVLDTYVDAINCTFANNTGGDGVIYVWSNNASLNTSMRIKNSIISHNDSPEAIYTFTSDTSVIWLTYTDISNNTNNWSGFIQGQQGLYGNISEDPLFVDLENDDFHLTANSPCIDAGDPLSPPDPDQTIADMGAYYYDQSGVGIESRFTDDQEVMVYPNPLTTSTNLSYSLDKATLVSISVYNSRGELIDLIEEIQAAGKQQLKWNSGRLPAGIYYFWVTTISGEIGNGKIVKL